MLTIRAHAAKTLRFALPVMVARAGLLVLVTVDTAMTGHAGAEELAYYSLAMAPQVPMLLVGIGLLMGTMVLCAQAQGGGNTRLCGAIWYVSMLHAAGLGTVFLVVFQAGGTLLSALGQAPELAAGGGNVLVMFGWGFPAMLLFASTSFFLEGIHRPKPGMLILLAANILNVPLNWAFIYGNWGAPAMGAEGAALATSIVRWLMLAAILVYLWVAVDFDRYGLRHVHRRWTPALGRSLRHLGYPMGISHGMESSAFAALTVFAGWLGPVQVSAMQIAMNLVALAFMCSIGFSAAASVRVASAQGARDYVSMGRAGWVAVGLAAGILGLLGLVFLFGADRLVALYADDPAVVALAVPAVALAAFVLVPDGTQGVLMGALRGIGDVWPAALCYGLSFWVIMVPLAYYLGVRQGGGASGLIFSVVFGCIVATALLGLRFARVTRAT